MRFKASKNNQDLNGRRIIRKFAWFPVWVESNWLWLEEYFQEEEACVRCKFLIFKHKLYWNYICRMLPETYLEFRKDAKESYINVIYLELAELYKD